VTITTSVTAVNALTAGPFGQLLASQPVPGDPAAAAEVTAGMGATLQAGTSGTGMDGDDSALSAGLSFTGLGAVASAIGTYLTGLSAAKRAQMVQGPVPVVQLGPAGFTCPVHNADIASLAATLTAVLNTSGNYGPAGT
jgi:hypothetical protein